jgi:hypothetical protein
MQDSAHPRLNRDIAPIIPVPEPTDNDCAEIVLNAYTSARPQDAFEEAVRTYRQRNPEVSTDAARRAVAEIICGKA